MIKIQPVGMHRRGEGGAVGGARCRKKGGGTPEVPRRGRSWEESWRRTREESGLGLRGGAREEHVGRAGFLVWSEAPASLSSPFLLPDNPDPTASWEPSLQPAFSTSPFQEHFHVLKSVQS